MESVETEETRRDHLPNRPSRLGDQRKFQQHGLGVGQTQQRRFSAPGIYLKIIKNYHQLPNQLYNYNLYPLINHMINIEYLLSDFLNNILSN